jgi:hypothetical protein
MSVVGLTMMSGDPVYVNPEKVTKLHRGDGDAAEQVTAIHFGQDDRVVVKGDIDHIAFQLFPTGVR